MRRVLQWAGWINLASNVLWSCSVHSLYRLVLCCSRGSALVDQGNRSGEARAVLARVGGRSLAKETFKRSKARSSPPAALWPAIQPACARPFHFSLPRIASELSGITIVFYYGPDILARSGLSLGRRSAASLLSTWSMWRSHSLLFGYGHCGASVCFYFVVTVGACASLSSSVFLFSIGR